MSVNTWIQHEYDMVRTEMEVVILAVAQDQKESNEMVQCYHSFIRFPTAQ